jgi:hypothetical protein
MVIGLWRTDTGTLAASTHKELKVTAIFLKSSQI